MNHAFMTARLIDHLVESRDDEKVLLEAASRLEPHAAEIASAWTGAAETSSHLAPEARAERQDQARALLVQALALLKANDAREFYLWIADQGERMALSGIGYEDLVSALETGQQFTLPFLVGQYAPGAELALATDALETLYHNVLTVLSGAYVQVVQEQVARGARQQSVGRMAGGVAHAMNNVLAAILGRTQILLHTEKDERLRRELNEIQKTAVNGAHTLRRLQEFARGATDDEPVETDVNEVVREAAELTRYRWRDEAEAAGIVIDVVRDLADVPPIHSVPALLREILVDLLFNAIEAMPRGGLVTLRTERVRDRVLITVSDTGEGMSLGALDKAFAPFYTTKGAGHAGLGLARARESAARLQGTLELTAPSDGARVTLSLPIAVRAEAEERAPVPPGNTARVLVIDDEPNVRDTALRLLSQQGHAVTTADSGLEAQRIVQEQGPFDLVITDLGMPGMSGWEIARFLRDHFPDTLVVLMTGWATSMDPLKLRESGIARVLQKPFDADGLLTLVNEALQVRQGK